MLADAIAGGDEIVIFNTWIPGLDIIADAIAAAVSRGSRVSILMLHPESDSARLRSLALQDGKHKIRDDQLLLFAPKTLMGSASTRPSKQRAAAD